MRKFGYILLGVIVVFIILMYASLWNTESQFKHCEILNFDDVSKIDFRKHDSVLVAASTLYQANELKILMQGQQYRKAWSAPVKVPIVFLDTLFGGMEILKEGGGKQTHSLKLKSENGIVYTLRSISKDPKPLVPEFAKTLGLENIIVDGISAQHPYGAILAAALSNKANVLHTDPKVVFLPKQKILGNYNEKFGNRLFLLEYETDGEVNWTKLSNVDELLDTEDLQELKLELKNRLTINKSALIRARLFDLLIGDWDRHTKQWGWAVQQRDSAYVAIPIAGDRDNAFFDSDGIIPSILSNENIIPELRPFEDDIDFMEGLVYPFDRYFLLNTHEDLFKTEAQQLKSLLTDDVIDACLEAWPDNIRTLDGKEITDKIKSRRNDLLEYAMLFKEIIDRKGAVKERLKGSEDLNLALSFLNCFECN